jgi:Arc/MetJ-type ribon-helix-helix transcriptional regulator
MDEAIADSVRNRLGPADLATVDALVVAGVAASRAEVIRWALGRIRENAAYAQLLEQRGGTGRPEISNADGDDTGDAA